MENENRKVSYTQNQKQTVEIWGIHNEENMRKICSKNLRLTRHCENKERPWETVNKHSNKTDGRTGTEMDSLGNKHC